MHRLDSHSHSTSSTLPDACTCAAARNHYVPGKYSLVAFLGHSQDRLDFGNSPTGDVSASLIPDADALLLQASPSA